MLTHNFTYAGALADSIKVNWQVQDLIGGDKRLDFSKHLLPEAFARVQGLSMLNAREKMVLNQIRGLTYVYLFGFVEEFIVPFVSEEAHSAMLGAGDPIEVRALLGFAEEETKHMQLFRTFVEEFKKGFHTPVGLIPGAADVAKIVLSHSKLAVGMLTLHLEWMTLAHYLESIKDDQDLDGCFKNMLKHHWMEESQHAKLDTLLVDKLATAGGKPAIEQAFTDFAALGAAVAGLLTQQAELDIVSLEAAINRKLSDADKKAILEVQVPAYHYTFIGSGLLTKNFLAAADQLSPGAAEQLKGMAKQLGAN